MNELPLNQIINGDCLEFMKTLPDKCIDLVITDPPYGINIAKSGTIGGSGLAKVKDYGKCEWDSEIPKKEIFDEILRISKNQIIFGGNYFIEYLSNSSCWIVWDKENGNNNFADCELAWTSFDKSVKRFKYRWNGMLQEDMKHKETRVHPTQKPVKLGVWILEKFAKEGDLIFDPFTGSGTFLIASKQKGFNFIGCEISKEYCDIANKRLRETEPETCYATQTRLF